jgi:hypothetical protein
MATNDSEQYAAMVAGVEEIVIINYSTIFTDRSAVPFTAETGLKARV